MFSQIKKAITHIRKPAYEVTPEYEDAGLFKTQICELMVELIPQTRQNDRNDTIIRAFVDRKSEVDVYFAGRRAAAVGPLTAQLRALMKAARAKAQADGTKMPPVENIRLPVRIEGAWRRRKIQDEHGWETGNYHFIAARWSLLDKDGTVVSFGEPRVH